MPYLFFKLMAVLLLLAGTATAQSGLYLEPRLGAGTFHMAAMKDFQKTIIQGSQVNAKATDTFGPYVQYGLNTTTDLNDRTRVGMFLERGSTGGRVAYKDYSGELQLDTRLSYLALGALIYTHEPIGTSAFQFITGLETNLFSSRLQVESYSRLYNEKESGADTFKSLGLGVKPFIGLQYPLLALPFNLTFGYLASANKPFHVPGKPDQQLSRNNGKDPLEPGWGGIRLNLSVSIPIIKAKE